MRIRGQRECQDCGTRWSYYDTGSVECPDCGSMRSVGIDEERKRHTDSPASLDLTAVRERFDRDPITEVTADAKQRCREYLRHRGFVRGGELLDLDETYLAAAETVQVADLVGRSFSPTDEERLYLLDLLAGADRGDRTPPDEVPEAMRAARGVAYADAIREYRREIREWVADRAGEKRHRTVPEVRESLDAVDQHAKRILALEGDVDPREVERLVEASRNLARALRDGDEGALTTARERIDGLE